MITTVCCSLWSSCNVFPSIEAFKHQKMNIDSTEMSSKFNMLFISGASELFGTDINKRKCNKYLKLKYFTTH